MDSIPPKCKNRTFIKKSIILKLKNIIMSSKYCCFCLENHDLCSLEDGHFVKNLMGSEVLSIRQVIVKLFGAMARKIMTSDYICLTCNNSAINSYTFMMNTKQNAAVFESYVRELDLKTNQIIEKVKNENKGNILIILDNLDEVLEIHKRPHCSMKHIDNVVQLEKPKTDNMDKLKKTLADGKPYKCNLCTGRYTSRRHLKIHKYRKHNIRLTKSDYSCSVCHNTFNSLKELRSHMSGHDLNAKHVCDVCNLIFDTKKEYKIHTKKVEHRTCIDPSIQNRMKFRNINCSVCHIKFSNITAMKKHMKTHSQDQKHSCLACSLEFKTRKEYLNHTLTVAHIMATNPNSLTEKITKCKYCNYTTYSKTRMKNHTVHKHLNMSPHICYICSKRLVTATTLQMHIKRHLGGKITAKDVESVCAHCGKLFHSNQAIKKHMLLHTGEKPYQCDLCELKFKNVSDRTFHKNRKHTEKSVFCPLCQIAYNTLSLMRAHVRKVHWKSDEKFDHTKLEGLSEQHYHLFKDQRVLGPF